MIEVTGSKTQPRESDPAQRYVLKDTDKKSKMPAVMGALLIGVALYLKSIFPSVAEPEAGKAVGEKEPGGAVEPTMAKVVSLDRPTLDEMETGTVDADSPLGSGGTLVDLAPPAEFMMLEPPKIGFFQEEAEVSWQPRTAPMLDGTAANDNSNGNGPGSRDDGVPAPVDEHDEQDNPPVIPTDPAVEEQPCSGNGNPGDETGSEEPRCEDDVARDEPCDEDDDGSLGNRAPRTTGPVYLYDVTGCAILAIGLADLLRNAVDPDGDMLSVQNMTVSSGTLTPSAEGWTFYGEPQMLGAITIEYQITDGEFSVGQSAHFSVVKSFIDGTDCDDLLVGTMCADDIVGGDGDDNIDARAGDDTISGGEGADHIVAGSGNDVIFGGAGHDIIFGGEGDDHISGGAGNDRLHGGDGDDIVFGDGGNDILSGGSGDDFLSGGDGNDDIRGDEGDDLVDGGAGDDQIAGGTGDDILMDGEGGDVVLGGAGNDHVITALDADDDFYDGGAGCDTLDYSATTQGVIVDLACGTAGGVEIGADTISGFETVIGGAGHDIISGGAGDDHISGGAGNDRLNGDDGDDIIFGDDGDDTLNGGSGDDLLSGGGGNDEIHGDEGDDLVDGGAGDDRIAGGAGDDVLMDGEGEDVVLGGDGNDHVIAALDADDDFYDGGTGCDTLDYSATTQGVTVDLACGTASGVEIGEDTISGFETVTGGVGDDHFVAGSAATVLAGGGGENLFEFASVQNESDTGAVMHEILDFEVGDRIRMSKYDIFERVLDGLEDRFEDVYGHEIDDDDIAIRYRQDRTDDIDRTIIEADLNKDDVYETTINVHGRHAFVFIEIEQA